MGTGMLLSGDLGFMIEGVFSFYIGDTEIWITTSHICLLIVLLVLRILIVLVLVVIHLKSPRFQDYYL